MDEIDPYHARFIFLLSIQAKSWLHYRAARTNARHDAPRASRCLFYSANSCFVLHTSATLREYF
ncbi:MAG TPA: hypothetical protein VKM55_19290 [Candidatus Lokiarchaeia archaeon]|nr:hypothetical protein [Candidatus Lokiarchaeia archaeon]